MAPGAELQADRLPPPSRWRIIGRLTQASNATLLVRIAGAKYVYKPVEGESPLWDFPRGTLGRREVAVQHLARLLGWDLVPATRWVDEGPHGPGMLQEWIEAIDMPVALFAEGQVAEGWLPVMRGYGEDGRDVVLAHPDDPQLERIALFDVIVNNADRKGGHLLTRADGTVLGIDHGLCLNADHKLRTVLWGFAGRPVPSSLLADVEQALPALGGAMDGFMRSEVTALTRRAQAVLDRPVFPRPRPHGPVIPWPPL